MSEIGVNLIFVLCFSAGRKQSGQIRSGSSDEGIFSSNCFIVIFVAVIVVVVVVVVVVA